MLEWPKGRLLDGQVPAFSAVHVSKVAKERKEHQTECGRSACLSQFYWSDAGKDAKEVLGDRWVLDFIHQTSGRGADIASDGSRTLNFGADGVCDRLTRFQSTLVPADLGTAIASTVRIEDLKGVLVVSPGDGRSGEVKVSIVLCGNGVDHFFADLRGRLIGPDVQFEQIFVSSYDTCAASGDQPAWIMITDAVFGQAVLIGAKLGAEAIEYQVLFGQLALGTIFVQHLVVGEVDFSADFQLINRNRVGGVIEADSGIAFHVINVFGGDFGISFIEAFGVLDVGGSDLAKVLYIDLCIQLAVDIGRDGQRLCLVRSINPVVVIQADKLGDFKNHITPDQDGSSASTASGVGWTATGRRRKDIHHNAISQYYHGAVVGLGTGQSVGKVGV